jgi:hypothetical protein
MYYDKLQEVHEKYIEFFRNNDDSNSMDDLTTSISTALIYRAESYMCAPTIYHVVYTMQSKASDDVKKPILDLIGKEGYKISILEQLGYLTRFYIQYVKPKFAKKHNKYTSRLHDALKKFQEEGNTFNEVKNFWDEKSRRNTFAGTPTGSGKSKKGRRRRRKQSKRKIKSKSKSKNGKVEKRRTRKL